MHDPKVQHSVPTALFDIEISSTDKSVKWSQGTVPPADLATFAVFDAHCARSYLSEGEVAYLPYGLDIVENLANKVLPELTIRLNKEIATLNTDTQPFQSLAGDTAVGKLIAALTPKTDTATVVKLATLSQAEQDRLGELDKALQETDPKAKAQDLRLSAQRRLA